MKYILSKTIHIACPSCGSSEVSRSQRKGWFESKLSSIFHIKPYRCLKCDYRHFRLRPDTGHAHRHSLISAPK
jgi:predicted RNA-binding Zn-ribbon protein involved in translation (DUF1610 family)